MSRRIGDFKIIVDRPWLKWCLLASALAVSLVCALVGFQLGQIESKQIPAQRLLKEREQLLEKTLELTAVVDEQRVNIEVLRKELEISEKASLHLQQDYKKYYDRLAALEEQITYYKRVLKPSSGDEGIVLGSLSIKQSVKPGVFRLVADILQVNGMTKVKGEISFTLIGRKAGKILQVPVINLGSAKGDEFRLNFKNYQSVRAEVELPAAFKAEQVRVVARLISGKKLTISRIYDWVLQES